MKNRLSKLAVAVCSLALLSTTPLAAQSCGDPCWDPCDWGGDFAIGVDALYWKPMHCTYNFGRRITEELDLTVNDILSVKADYDWGFRLYAGYMRDCTFLDVSYLWLETRDAFRAGDDVTIFPLNLPVDRTVARINFNYQNVDFRLGQVLHKSCGCSFYVFADARWVCIEEERQLSGFVQNNGNTESFLTHKSKFDGGGIGVGMGGQFNIFCGFSGFGRLSGLAILGDRTTPVETFAQGTGVATTTFNSSSCVIPALDLRLGLDYQWECGCLTTLWEVGYEMDYYFQVVDTVDEVNEQLVSLKRSCKDLGFAGPYVGVKVLF